MLNSSQATISSSKISENGEEGIVMVGSSQATIRGSKIFGNDDEGIMIAESSQATIRDNEIFENGGYGVALRLKRCGFVRWGAEEFEGKVEGSENEIHGNEEGNVCPSELGFLMTSSGGCYGPLCD